MINSKTGFVWLGLAKTLGLAVHSGKQCSMPVITSSEPTSRAGPARTVLLNCKYDLLPLISRISESDQNNYPHHRSLGEIKRLTAVSAYLLDRAYNYCACLAQLRVTDGSEFSAA